MVLIGQCLLLLIKLMCMSYVLKTQIGIAGNHFVPEPLFLHSFIIPIPVFGVIMYKNVSFLFTSSKALVLYFLFKVFCKIWIYAGIFTLLAPFAALFALFFHNMFTGMLFAKYCNFGDSRLGFVAIYETFIIISICYHNQHCDCKMRS